MQAKRYLYFTTVWNFILYVVLRRFCRASRLHTLFTRREINCGVLVSIFFWKEHLSYELLLTSSPHITEEALDCCTHNQCWFQTCSSFSNSFHFLLARYHHLYSMIYYWILSHKITLININSMRNIAQLRTPSSTH